MRAAFAFIVVLASLAAVAGAAARSATVCREQCRVEVQATRFKAVGAGASGSTLTLRVGATVKWRLRGSRHSVVGDRRLFSFGPDDTSFTIRPSAGRYVYRDTVGGAGAGTLIVHPRFKALPGGAYRVTWGSDAIPPPDRVHDVRWFVVAGSEVIGEGTWYRATHESGRTFTRDERLTRGLRLAHGRSLCVEVRTGRGVPTRWSGWTNACIGV